MAITISGQYFDVYYSDPQSITDPSLVDVSLYRTTKQQVESLMLAGERLVADRRLSYHLIQGDIDDDGYFFYDYGSDELDILDGLQLLKDRLAEKQTVHDNVEAAEYAKADANLAATQSPPVSEPPPSPPPQTSAPPVTPKTS